MLQELGQLDQQLVPGQSAPEGEWIPPAQTLQCREQRDEIGKRARRMAWQAFTMIQKQSRRVHESELLKVGRRQARSLWRGSLDH